MGSSDNSAGNLTSIGHQNFFKDEAHLAYLQFKEEGYHACAVGF